MKKVQIEFSDAAWEKTTLTDLLAGLSANFIIKLGKSGAAATLVVTTRDEGNEVIVVPVSVPVPVPTAVTPIASDPPLSEAA